MKNEVLKNKISESIQNQNNVKFEPVNSEYRLKHSYEIIDYLQPLIHNNKKVMMTSQVAQVFGVEHNKLLYNFRKHKHDFELTEDYYFFKGKELKNFCHSNNLSEYISSTYCWTQNGVILLAKILKNFREYNKSMEIYQNLVDGYFEIDATNSYTIITNKLNKDCTANINKLIVKNVDLFGDTVVAAQDKNGVIWAGVKWFCDGLGLSEGQRQRQTTNIQSDIVLSKGVANLHLPTNGGNQDVLCLQLDYVPLWLAKISITPNMKKNNPELVDKLIKYQLEAKDVLAAAFLSEIASDTSSVNSFRYHTSSTKVPKVKDTVKRIKLQKSNDWFYNNYNKIEKILDSFGWERSYLYHIILKTIGQEYDLQAAESIYEKELGISVEYAMDIVEYFDELSKAATKILNKLIKGISNMN